MSLLEPRTSLDMIPDFVVIYDVPWDEFKEFEKTSGDFSSEEDQESDRCLSTVKAEEKELDARAVQALADQAVVMDCPSRHAAVGPGTGVPGPRRYIGVLRPVLLFSMMRQWVHEHSLGNASSWATFRRALKKARVYLSFRKSSGQHATCDHCKWPLVERFSSCSASWLEVLLPVGSKTLSPGRKTGRRPCNQVTRLD